MEAGRRSSATGDHCIRLRAASLHYASSVGISYGCPSSGDIASQHAVLLAKLEILNPTSPGSTAVNPQ